jgi:putative hydrolase
MSDPFGGGSGGFDPRMFSQVPLFRELAKIMSWRGGPVNWDLAQQTAASVTASEGGTRALPGGDRSEAELAQAVGAAELWLDAITELPAVDGPARAMSVEEWLQLANRSDGLGLYVEPVASGMSEAMTRSMPEELRGMLPGLGDEQALTGVLGPMGAMLYGVQVGVVSGHLAGQLLGTYDLGVPTVEARLVGTVGDGLRRFAQEYDFDETELRFLVALRETAHRRQFAGVPWLRGHLADLLRRFAAGADPDPSGLLEQFGGMGLDPMALADPEQLRGALENPETFRVEPTPAQRQVLTRLQALVAFTEGWVDSVVGRAAAGKLPSLSRMEEALRRRRAEKGAGERSLEQLIGLDLRHHDVRAGLEFCEAVLDARGQAGLDRAWRSPETLPTAEEVTDPSRWLVRMAAGEEASDLPGLDELPEVPDDLSGLDPGR